MRHPGLYEQFNKVFKKYFSGRRVLDVACGNGFFSYQIAEYAECVTGIDWSEELIALANKNAHLFQQDRLCFDEMSAFEITNEFLEQFEYDCIFFLKAGGGWPRDKYTQFLKVISESNTKFFINNINKETRTDKISIIQETEPSLSNLLTVEDNGLLRIRTVVK
jgi:SAM-dependent methyltransferase